MDAKTLEALQGSIAKWEAIVAGTGGDNGVENCPLCLMFNNEDSDLNLECNGCPVAKRSGATGCECTPYTDWWHMTSPPFPRRAETSEQKQAAQAELDFLRSLLSWEAT